MKAAGRRGGADRGRADGSGGSLAAAVERVLPGVTGGTGDGSGGAPAQTGGLAGGWDPGAVDQLAVVRSVF